MHLGGKKKHIRKGSMEIYIQLSTQGREREEREVLIPKREYILELRWVHCATLKPEPWTSCINLILSMVKPPHLHGGRHEGDAASATWPVFTTVMNSRERKKIITALAYYHPVSFPKGNTSTGNWICVHDWYDTWLAHVNKLGCAILYKMSLKSALFQVFCSTFLWEMFEIL